MKPSITVTQSQLHQIKSSLCMMREILSGKHKCAVEYLDCLIDTKATPTDRNKTQHQTFSKNTHGKLTHNKC